MKKRGIALLLVLAIGVAFAAANVSARGYCGGPGGGYGARGWNINPADDPVYQKFMEESADLRKSLAVDRAELNALMAGENPDPAKAGELAGKIAENQIKLREMANASGFGPRGGGGYAGCNGPGAGYGACTGPGAARGGYSACAGGPGCGYGPAATGCPGPGGGFGGGNAPCH